MSKELEEIKSIIAIHFCALGFFNPNENEQILKDRDKVLNALNRLESIDNAEPNEALKCLGLLGDFEWHKKSFKEEFPDLFDTIKQALLKAQEPKKYLKWEDLEWEELETITRKDIKVKLNGTEYGLEFAINFGSKEVVIFDEKEFMYVVFNECHKQFFNDLHLEVIKDE